MYQVRLTIKSSDAGCMDFFWFGLLKQTLVKSRSDTLNGVWKLPKAEWIEVNLEEIGEATDSLKGWLNKLKSKLDYLVARSLGNMLNEQSKFTNAGF